MDKQVKQVVAGQTTFGLYKTVVRAGFSDRDL